MTVVHEFDQVEICLYAFNENLYLAAPLIAHITTIPQKSTPTKPILLTNLANRSSQAVILVSQDVATSFVCSSATSSVLTSMNRVLQKPYIPPNKRER